MLELLARTQNTISGFFLSPKKINKCSKKSGKPVWEESHSLCQKINIQRNNYKTTEKSGFALLDE